jgi:spermidine synthase
VEIIPGEKDYLLASDTPLDISIGALMSDKPFDNLYVNPYYIDDEGIQQRSEKILREIDPRAPVNKIDKGLPVFYTTLRFLSLFHYNPKLILILPFMLVLGFLVMLRKTAKGMFVAGFTGASSEIILLFVFQIALGYVYAAIGILIALFMAGLALGSWIGKKQVATRNNYHRGFVFLMAYLLLLAGFLSTNYYTFHPLVLWTAFVLFMLIPAFLTGFIYVQSTTIEQIDAQRTAPIMYAADLAGSASGVILLSMFCIPIAGLRNTTLLLLILCLVPLFFSWFSRKNNNNQ